jgi:predicted dehydrogenase
VAENYECEPGIQAAGEIIKSGKIGDVAFFKLTAINHLEKSNKYYQTSWRTIPEVGLNMDHCNYAC